MTNGAREDKARSSRQRQWVALSASSKHEPVFTMARELPWKVARATRLPMEAAASQKQAPSERHRRRLGERNGGKKIER